jgi:DUF4097 and DUF4098 domain-containing protein YvlB
MRRGSLVAPLLLIALGALFLARNVYPDLPLLDYLARYWPFLLVLWGGLRLVEILVWYARRQPLPRNGISGGEWILAIFLCFLGGSIHAARNFTDWLPNSGLRVGGLDVFGESFEYPVNAQKPASRAPQIVIESFRGNARIVGGDTSEVRVTGRKTVRALNQGAADRADKSNPFEIAGDENRIVIRANQDRVPPNQRVSADLDIAVPRGSSVEAHGRAGDFDISNIDGRVTIDSDNAGVRLEKIGGDVRLNLRRSDIVRALGVKGSLEMKGRGTDINLESLEGPVTIDGAYSGLAEIRNAAKPVHFINSFSEFQAESVPGGVRLSIGEINGGNLAGPVRVTASRNKDVRLSEVTNALDISLERGDIQITSGALPLPKIDARTRSGDIELGIPPGAKFTMNASSERGAVLNDFGAPLTFSAERRGGTLHGSNGGPEIELHTNRGSITIRKSTSLNTAPGADRLKPVEQ